ncbi:hypothetical protein V5799_007359 [Amblyomma americanum]|uniref:Uncharacterized protein n=1 Tax=Amblyomma americanum TaxID=6943 RepID=A0AAQ4DTS1_AMBAM
MNENSIAQYEKKEEIVILAACTDLRRFICPLSRLQFPSTKVCIWTTDTPGDDEDSDSSDVALENKDEDDDDANNTREDDDDDDDADEDDDDDGDDDNGHEDHDDDDDDNDDDDDDDYDDDDDDDDDDNDDEDDEKHGDDDDDDDDEKAHDHTSAFKASSTATDVTPQPVSEATTAFQDLNATEGSSAASTPSSI